MTTSREILGRMSQCVGRMDEAISRPPTWKQRDSIILSLEVLRELIVMMGESLTEQDRVNLEKQLQDSLKMIADTGRPRA